MMLRMWRFIGTFCLWIAFASSALAQERPWEWEEFLEAERLFGEGSYLLASEAYQKIPEDAFADQPDALVWLNFRRLDAQWRAQSGSQPNDTRQTDDVWRSLERLISDRDPQLDPNGLDAAMLESAGDYWWVSRFRREWHKAWRYYDRALDIWAQSPDLSRARSKYLAIIWKASRPTDVNRYYIYGGFGNYIPVEVLENAVRIAETAEDQAHANYLLARSLQPNDGLTEFAFERIQRAYKEAIRGNETHAWMDDALAQYAQWLSHSGKPFKENDGRWSFRSDYPSAVKIWQKLLDLYDKEETRYYNDAVRQIRDITEARLDLNVGNAFVPGSKIRLHADWRNIKDFRLKLFPIDLVKDIQLVDGDLGPDQWVKSVRIEGKEPAVEKSFETEDQGQHEPGSREIILEDTPEEGAYLAVSYADGAEESRELILISQLSVLAQASSNRMLIWVCDARNGRPIPNAEVKLWKRYRQDRKRFWDGMVRTSDEQGLVVVELEGNESSYEWLVATRHGRQQNLTVLRTNGYRRFSSHWKIYAFTDRPVYRPEDSVHWKAILRSRSDDGYTTPRGHSYKVRIYDPKNAVVLEESVTLNDFGSIQGEWNPTREAALGLYRISFLNGEERQIGSADLFRLEEYKRPEMKLSLGWPGGGSGSEAPAPRPGDRIKLELSAEYYFGGPVINGEAQIRVYRRPHYFMFPVQRPYAWLYDDNNTVGIGNQRSYWRRNESLEHEMTVKTDAKGKATIEFESSDDLSSDMNYRVEVRLTDSSRREVVTEHEVRVSRQGHFVQAKLDRKLVQPGEKATFDYLVLDVNERPLQIEGAIKVIRKRWREVWWNPDGLELEGAALERVRRMYSEFPPPPSRPDQRPWRLKEKGYASEVVQERTVTTNAEGHAELTFTPAESGYYTALWTSEDKRPGGLPGPGKEIRSETALWVRGSGEDALGYKSEGVEIIIDKDTFKAGETAPIMLSVPTNDRWVLLTLGAESMIEHRVVHVEGTTRMVPLEIHAAHIPNFYIQALMVDDYRVSGEKERVTVPPVQEFLKVQVTSDKANYQPREKAVVDILVTNDEGKPVEGEISLAVFDESVTYIQQDIAGDPRFCFYGDTRTLISENEGPWHEFINLIQLKDGRILSDEDIRRYREMGVNPENVEKDLSFFWDTMDARKAMGIRGFGGGGLGGGGGLDVGFAVRGGVNSIDPSGLPQNPEMMRRYGLVPSARGVLAGGTAPGGAVFLDAAFPESMVAMAKSGDEQVEIIVRNDFRATAFWEPSILTDQEGKGHVEFEMPDTLTTWKLDARAVTRETKVGTGEASVGTRHPLLVRLQHPRFLVVGDQAVISTTVNNQTDEDIQAKVTLETENIIWAETIEAPGVITIPAHGEHRIDWSGAVAIHPGEIKLNATVKSDTHGDAVEMTLPAYEHGIEQFLAWTGKSFESEINIPVAFPSERKAGSTQLVVQVSPSLAVTMLDAVPYLIDFPYGCTEQTLSRFVPAMAVRKTLEDLGLPIQVIEPGKFGGVNPDHVDSTHRSGYQSMSKLDKVTAEGLKRLKDLQHADGGWSWWESGDADLFMSAYVVWGLSLAKKSGLEFERDLLLRGRDFLASNIVRTETMPDLQAWLLHAIHSVGVRGLEEKPRLAVEAAWDNAWQQRDSLNAYSRALLALAAHDAGKVDEANTLIRNLENGVIQTKASAPSQLQAGTLTGGSGATAHWGEDGIYHRWSDGGVEATSVALRALLAIDPDNALVEPVVRWLIQNRRGAHWSNTRDTAMTLLALNDYLKVSGELESDLQYELYAGDTLVATERVTPENIFKAPSRFVIPDEWVKDSTSIRIVKTDGSAPVYYAAEASWFSLEEPVPAAGNHLFVRRDYFRLKETPTLLKGTVLERVPVEEGEALESGDRVEVVLILEARNHYEYLLIEDLKPAGLEAVELQSGGRASIRQLSQRTIDQLEADGRPSLTVDRNWRFTGRQQRVHQEWRDRKVALFVDRLPEGVWEMRYTLRAEVPGEFHALPAIGHAMYIPEIRGNSEERHFGILDSTED